MAQATFQIEHLPDAISVKISGDILEGVDFAEIPIIEGRHLVLNLEHITAINSIGIKNWILWSASIKKQTVILEKCPPCIVNAASLVSGFLLPNFTVRSFYVPYYSEANEEEALILFCRGVHFKEDQLTFPRVLNSAGKEMAIDIMPARYFSFLKKMRSHGSQD